MIYCHRGITLRKSNPQEFLRVMGQINVSADGGTRHEVRSDYICMPIYLNIRSKRIGIANKIERVNSGWMKSRAYEKAIDEYNIDDIGMFLTSI